MQSVSRKITGSNITHHSQLPSFIQQQLLSAMSGCNRVKNFLSIDFLSQRLFAFPLAGLAGLAVSATSASAALVNSTAGFTTPIVSVNFDPIPLNTFSPGPLLFTTPNGDEVQFTSTNGTIQDASVINYEFSYGFSSNGEWFNLSMAGLNAPTGYMDFKFTGDPVSAVGGFLNWAPNSGPNQMYIAALDSIGNVLESYTLNFSTGGGTNTGLNYYIQRNMADIAALRLGDSFVGLANFTYDAGEPVPGPIPILGVGVAFGSIRKMRKFSSQLKNHTVSQL